MYRFKQTHEFCTRILEACRLRRDYPEEIPLICEVTTGINEPSGLACLRVSKAYSIGDFMNDVKKRVNDPDNQLINVYFSGILLDKSIMIAQLYDQHKDEDLFLYLSVRIFWKLVE